MPVLFGLPLLLLTLIKLIESVQRRAARWICSTWNPQSHQWSKSLDDCISELHWPSLQSRWQFLSLSILYDIWKGRTGINFSDCFEVNTLCTGLHSLTLKMFSSTINAFRYCFLYLWHSCGTLFLRTFWHEARLNISDPD